MEPRKKDQFYTQQELAELLKVSTRTIQNWIKDGQIKAIRIGRTVRIPASEIDRLVGR